MKNLFIFIFCFTSFFVQAQFKSDEFIEVPKSIIKFGPRIFSPRIAFEKIKNQSSSFGFEVRAYAYWIPIGGKVEGFYRRYFKPEAPFAPYVHIKAVAGAFSYSIVDNTTYGLSAGGGVNFGRQYNVGRKKATIEIYGGIQIVAPIYLNYDNRASIGIPDYNLIHYTTFSFPLEFGVRFGFMKTKLIPKPKLDDGGNPAIIY